MIAIIFGFGFSALGSFLTFNTDTEKLASTPFGKYVIARLHPANLTFQITGYVVSMYGLVTLGHLWGWGRKVIP